MAAIKTDLNKTKVKTKLKVNDEVIVIAGKMRKQRGKLLAIDKDRGRVIVQGVNLRKKFTRPSQENPKGGQVEIEQPIHISNVQLFDAKSKKGTRIKMVIANDGKKSRVAVASGKEV